MYIVLISSERMLHLCVGTKQVPNVVAGADPGIIKAMAEAAKKSSHDGHDSNAHMVDALAALQKHGHDEAKEEHHSGGLFGLFGH